jgi:hypothetical protein
MTASRALNLTRLGDVFVSTSPTESSYRLGHGRDPDFTERLRARLASAHRSLSSCAKYTESCLLVRREPSVITLLFARNRPGNTLGVTAIYALARSFLEPLLRAGSAMWTARPATGSAFARLKFLDRALDSAATRCFLFSRDDPTGPFVPRQWRQILPSRARHRVRAERHAQVRRGSMQKHHCAPLLSVASGAAGVPRVGSRIGWGDAQAPL